MGLFTHVRCCYRLPDPEAQIFAFQTKSLPEQLLDDYEITVDGRLLHQAYNTRWEENTDAPLGCYLHHENSRWEPVDFTDELEIHTSSGEPGRGDVWYSYLVEFDRGKVLGLQHGPNHGIPLPSPPLSKAITAR
ncbi:MAG TPA: hypothetical protein VFA18_13910 [Gemmataceae bacterium]|nr:hypothetical protein [Gemmataceae bacterium]